MRKPFAEAVLLLPTVVLAVVAGRLRSAHPLAFDCAWCGYVALVFAVLIRLVRQDHYRRVRMRRQFLGLCLSCGYDVRASRGVCPECGQAIRPALLTRGEHFAPAAPNG